MKTKLFIVSTLMFAVLIAGCENTGCPANTSANNTATTAEEPAVPVITEAEAKTELNALATAVGSNDIAALEKIYADDYHLVSNTGTVETKAQRIESMKSGNVKYQSVEFKDPKVRIYGNVAVVVTDSAGKMTVDGKPTETSFTATIIFVKSKDGIREVSAHLTDKPKQ